MANLTLDDIDLLALRDGRLHRLQAAMRDHDLEVCVLFNEPNVRYATGATAMPIWSNTTFVRCAVVPAEGRPILFEHGNSIHRSRLIADDVRPIAAWEFYDDQMEQAVAWAVEVDAAIREVGATGPRIAVDRLGTPGFLALQALGYDLVDSAPATQEARQVKTPEEIALFDLNGPIVVEMLTAFEDAIAPGVTERDLLATLAETGLRRGIEHLATNTVVSGPNGNPWRAEATDRVLEDGDLVFVDTDTVGVGGAFFCVSRTFPVGTGGQPRRRSATRTGRRSSGSSA